MPARQLRFKVDENLPVEVAGLLRAAGHEACTVADQRMSGAPDAALADVCRAESRAVVTLDLDFADIRRHPPAGSPRIVVPRLATQDRAHILAASARVIPRLQAETLAGALWIVEADAVRVRLGTTPPQG